jgi:hypothetical protein
MKFAIIAREKATYPIDLLCSVLDVLRPDREGISRRRRRAGTRPKEGGSGRPSTPASPSIPMYASMSEVEGAGRSTCASVAGSTYSSPIKS